jgi:WD40 repeat protein
MLTDSNVQTSLLESTWREASTRTNSEFQHKGLETADAEWQTDSKPTAEKETQYEYGNFSTRGEEGADGEEKKTPMGPQFTDEQILTFLRKSSPLMEAHLEDNVSVQIFDGYNSIFADSNVEPVTKQLSLVHAPTTDGGITGSSFGEASAVAWNSTGNTVAVAFGRAEHQGWCSHRSGFAVWNTLRRQMRLDFADRQFETPCCVTCVAFHPVKPSVLATGMYNGEVRVWDIALPKALLLTSTTDDYAHREPVSRIAWVRDFNQVARVSYHIAAASTDGKVLFWSPLNKFAWPTAGAALRPSAHYHGQGAKVNRFHTLGATAMGFSMDFLTFVTGTEAGGLLRFAQSDKLRGVRKKYLTTKGKTEFKWSLDAARLMESSDNKVEVRRKLEAFMRGSVKTAEQKAQETGEPNAIEGEHVFKAGLPPSLLWANPATFAFKPHSGPVTAVAFSPFNRDIFLTASSDGGVRLYNSQSAEPLNYFRPDDSETYLYDVAWSPERPLVFAVAGATGKVRFRDKFRT